MMDAKRLFPLLLCALIVFHASGCGQGDEQEETAQAGTYTIARGTLIVDVTASGNLRFSTQEDLAFDMAGTVEDVFVEEGDSVAEGDIVATLDTSDWEDQLRSLEIAVLSAEISLKQAEMALEAAKEETRTSITGDVVVICCPDEDEIEIREMQVEQARLRLEDTRAQRNKHLTQSPEVVAPFDGFVIAVIAEGGDEVFKGSVAVTVADPDRFEALIYVSEDDITQVVIGTQAEVEVDSLSSVVLPAEVTAVSPTATVSSGVVNYEVTVTIASLEEIQARMQEMRAQMSDVTGGTPAGQLPPALQAAIEAGTITEDEAHALIESTRTEASGGGGAAAMAALQDISLREGLSVSVTLLIAEKADVLLVPNAAIGKSGNQNRVSVIGADGSEEARTITTGLSNWQFTEVTDGLREGEVVKTSGTVAATGQLGRRPGTMMPMGGNPHG
jgi:multidrug efflux pump subunit AcrA (membrane-fusion protein)